jgi:predicted RNA binding protein YcfA (HicA-like mRNA interferase family)
VSPRLKRLSGDQVVAILKGLGFVKESQRGGHVKLVRAGPEGERQVLTVPLHSELDVGTLRAIVRQAARFVTEAELRARFYVE